MSAEYSVDEKAVDRLGQHLKSQAGYACLHDDARRDVAREFLTAATHPHSPDAADSGRVTGDAAERAAYEEWFRGEQGKPYDGCWVFGRAAWLKRAALAAQGHGDVVDHRTRAITERGRFEYALKALVPSLYERIRAEAYRRPVAEDDHNEFAAWAASLAAQGQGEAVAEVYEYPRDHREPVPTMLTGIRFTGMPLPIGTKLYPAPPASPAGVPDELYRNACESVESWKARAIKAEETADRLMAALNDITGPTFMGEPVLPKPAASPDIKAMVNRFLDWRLPSNFSPDCYISFDPEPLKQWPGMWPVGTNLLDADQAEQMFRYVLAAPSETPEGGEVGL